MTLTDVSTTCVTSVDTIRTPVVDVIGQLIRDDIGRLSVEPRCNWLGRLNSDDSSTTSTYSTIHVLTLDL